jgi:translation initiation factor 5
MQRVITKIEGNGNGIKTVVPNISEIADKLGREVECLMKYFAHELAVTTKFKDDKWIMTGSFQQDTIQATLFDFVKKFVLCKECRNPETIVQMDEKKRLMVKLQSLLSCNSYRPQGKTV